jgi:hypothetical protein
VVTTSSDKLVLYVGAKHFGVASVQASKVFNIIVCNNEAVTAVSSSDVVITFQLGATETLNVG